MDVDSGKVLRDLFWRLTTQSGTWLLLKADAL